MNTKEKSNRIVGLDQIRFLASVGIMAYHYFFIGVLQGFYSNEVFHPVAFLGEFGVDIFFIISGFVILMTTERKKTPLEFLKARAIRIYPAFILCSIFTLVTGVLMPNTNFKDLLFRWINSMTFYNDVWGVSPLSSIYWTLMVEVKFYILVAVVMLLGIWKHNEWKLLTAWECIAIINIFVVNNEILDKLLVLKYSGHMTLGILMYLYYNGKREKDMILPLLLSLWLIYHNFISYTVWIRGIYAEIPYSDIDILFIALLIIGIIYMSTGIELKNTYIIRIICYLGALSFTLYLIHADFGYFIRTQYYNYLIVKFPQIHIYCNEHIIMIVEILASFCVASIFLAISNKFTKFLSIKSNKEIRKY